MNNLVCARLCKLDVQGKKLYAGYFHCRKRFPFRVVQSAHLRFHRLSVDLLSQWQFREVKRLAQSPESSPGFLKPLGLEVLSKEADLV